MQDATRSPAAQPPTDEELALYRAVLHIVRAWPAGMSLDEYSHLIGEHPVDVAAREVGIDAVRARALLGIVAEDLL